jgi:probable F420-dependent oxidoreductase
VSTEPAINPQTSIHLTNFAADGSRGWARLFDLAKAAERFGVDRLVVSDHIAFGQNLAAYSDPRTGGALGRKQPTGPDGHWLEPMTLLAAVAGQTSRIRLSTGILLAALRRPAVLAKEAATLDVLSNGRLDLGVGIGWQREEYEVCGLDYHRRGDLLDQTLSVCQQLWSHRVANYHDDNLTFEHIHSMPKPVQAGGVPIWVSGRVNQRTVNRVVKFGTGWIPWDEAASDPRPGIALLREALADVGRDPSRLGVQTPLRVLTNSDGSVSVSATLAPVHDLVEAGVTDFRLVHRWAPGPDIEEILPSITFAFREMTASA